MRRHQVRAPERSWDDPGPDLLRKTDNAVDAMLKLAGSRKDEHVGRVLRAGAGGADWYSIGRRSKVRPWLESALEGAHDGDRVQLGLRRWGDVTIRAVARTSAIAIEPLANAHAGVELVNALFAHAFPASIFAGAFVCKTIEGTSPPEWSDHAWGDAGDRTSSANAPNDLMTDWLARMAASGNVPLGRGYLLGSQSGKVVAAKPRLVGSWKLEPTNASSSHLWHVHYSVVDHGGARPPCAG